MKKFFSKKRILFIDPADILGGAELFTIDLIKTICGKFDIHIATGAQSSYREKLRGTDISIHTQKLPKLKPITPITILRLVKARKKMAKLIDEIQPDIIVSNTVRSHIIVSSVTKKKGKKLIWFAHDNTIPGWLLKRLVRFPDRIFTCSRYIKNMFVNIVGDEYGKKIFPIYNGVDLENMKRPEEKKEGILIGSVGRIIPWKGQEYFIKAAKVLAKENNDWRFKIIGRMQDSRESKKYFKKLKNLIADTPNIEIVKDCENVLNEIAGFDAFIHSSVTPEPFGRVIIEAMALRVPVIVSNQGGPAEIIDDGVDGFIVDPKNTKLLTDKIKKIITDKKMMELFVENAYSKVEENYTLKKVSQKFINTVNKL